ncbi:MAG: DUF2142 domain-containing protein [Proteobacteria bacterium]|nr:DUF2142 domain-containing protein [Pseudomonadota bacterium]MBU4382172.1 DUF2142 domain-containing protein [Pseudomonadota bacterium]MCG2763048.1 DUF2142 domain-containing protein [Desulfarculaceae bacterium]
MISNSRFKLSCNKISLWTAAFIFIAGMFLSFLIPPLQSPDELDHIERAYLLSKGTIILDAPEGRSSGGMIDTGLLDYFRIFRGIIFKPDKKLSLADSELAKSINWTGAKKFRPAYSISYYFPLLYVPQAVGLAIGEKTGLSIDFSYRLARLLSLLAIAVIILVAFNIYQPNPLVIALLVLPMSLFQMASASIDGLSLALTILSMACFLRIVQDKTNSNPLFYYLLTCAVLVLSTGRIYLAPLILLNFMACYYLKNRKYCYLCVLSVVLIVLWFIVAVYTTVDKRLVMGASTLEIALLYLQHPSILIHAFASTISNAAMTTNYLYSFVGVLGWLDTQFYIWQYTLFLLLLLSICGLSISAKDLRTDWLPRSAILLCVLSAIFIMFFLLLVTWNKYPAAIIDGVQGRYFLPPAIMISYAIAGRAKLFEGLPRKMALVLVLALCALTLLSMPRLLLKRYYLAGEPLKLAASTMHGEPRQGDRPTSAG